MNLQTAEVRGSTPGHRQTPTQNIRAVNAVKLGTPPVPGNNTNYLHLFKLQTQFNPSSSPPPPQPHNNTYFYSTLM